MSIGESILAHKPNQPKALALMGTICFKLQRYDQAYNFHSAAVKVDSSIPLHNNYLGLTLLQLSRYDEALSYLKKASKGMKDMDVLVNIAAIYQRVGPHDKCLDYLKQATKMTANQPVEKKFLLYLNYVSTLELMRKFPRLELMTKEGVQACGASPISKIFAIMQGVNAFLAGDIQEAKEHVQSIGSMEIVSQILAHLIAFAPDQSGPINSLGAYFIVLLHCLNDTVIDKLTAPESLPAFYMLGDSHSVPAAWQKINYNGTEHQVVTHLVRGIKAWHLVGRSGAAFKDGFKVALDSLPKGATFMVSVGEIDCRMDEGVIPASLKSNKDRQKEVVSLVEKTVEWLMAEAKARNLTLLLYGIPAPKPEIPDVSMMQMLQLQVNTVRAFNETLKQQAEKRDLDMVDPYSATTNEKGLNNQSYFMDGRHLQPAFYVDAFKKYFIKNSA